MTGEAHVLELATKYYPGWIIVPVLWKRPILFRVEYAKFVH